MCVHNFYLNILYGSRVMGNFHVFTIWTLAKLRPMNNDSFQFLWLDLVNINWHANFIKLFHKVQELRPVSLFQNLDLGKASTDEIWHLNSLRIESINIKVCPVSFLRNTISEQNRISKSCLCDWSGTKT